MIIWNVFNFNGIPQGIILGFPVIVHENEDDIGAVILGIAVKNCIAGMCLFNTFFYHPSGRDSPARENISSDQQLIKFSRSTRSHMTGMKKAMIAESKNSMQKVKKGMSGSKAIMQKFAKVDKYGSKWMCSTVWIDAKSPNWKIKIEIFLMQTF